MTDCFNCSICCFICIVQVLPCGTGLYVCISVYMNLVHPYVLYKIYKCLSNLSLVELGVQSGHFSFLLSVWSSQQSHSSHTEHCLPLWLASWKTDRESSWQYWNSYYALCLSGCLHTMVKNCWFEIHYIDKCMWTSYVFVRWPLVFSPPVLFFTFKQIVLFSSLTCVWVYGRNRLYQYGYLGFVSEWLWDDSWWTSKNR